MNEIYNLDNFFFNEPKQLRSIKNTYDEKGYVLIKNFITQEYISKLKDEIDRLINEYPKLITFENSVIQGTGKVIHKISHFIEKSKPFRKLALHHTLLEILSQLFEEEAVLCTDKINFKQPGGRGFYPHQDMSGMWQKYLSNIITAFFAIDLADKENGCLEIASGWHRSGMLGPYMSSISEEHLHLISFDAIPLQPGDLIIFDGYAPHKSAPNFTSRSRRSILFTYNRISEGVARHLFLKDLIS